MKTSVTLLFFLMLGSVSCAQQTQYLHLTSIESIIPGGLGRSRMIITDSDGMSQETEMENFYSITGINFGNIKKNEAQILAKIADIERQGWQLWHVTAGVQSPAVSETSQQQGIYMTRYLFRRRQ